MLVDGWDLEMCIGEEETSNGISYSPGTLTRTLRLLLHLAPLSAPAS